MAKLRLTPKTIFGAAVLGALVYGLARKKGTKQIRREVEQFVKDVVKKSEQLGDLTRQAYADAVDMATKVYAETRDLTAKQKEDLIDLGEELKKQWKELQKKRSRR